MTTRDTEPSNPTFKQSLSTVADDDQVGIPLLGGRDDLLGRMTDPNVHCRLYARGACPRAELAELGVVVAACVLDDRFGLDIFGKLRGANYGHTRGRGRCARTGCSGQPACSSRSSLSALAAYCGYLGTKMLFGRRTWAPTFGLSTSCVMATFPAMLTS